MNALIFAAGLGTRLKPLTNSIPKALVEVNGKPLLWYAIQQVKQAGINRIVVNVHHFADKIESYLREADWGECELIVSDERARLLDTGGGLLHAASLFKTDEPILLYNADVLCDVKLTELINYHLLSTNSATLVVQKRKGTRYLLFDDQKQLVGWHNSASGEYKMSRQESHFTTRGFCGIHVLDYNVLPWLGEKRKFSMTEAYLELAKDQSIAYWELPLSNYWFDVGSMEKRDRAEKFLSKRQ
jgi:NDP-sugar pyrophosphorylase family protein